ncbi:zinc-binding alcohol dehydrogenase family protein [Yinghuangia aomiensis]
MPEPGPGEVRVRVEACGVCRTDLHLAEGTSHRTVPGPCRATEVVGRVDAAHANATRFALGDRIGIAWLRHTCGECKYCAAGRENLCPNSAYTGWDADGGFAEHAVVPEEFAYPLPNGTDPEHLAPLLCAGIIGYRALERAELPPGGRLGIYGFGASAHLAAQVALARGATVHVMTRAEPARRLALALGAASAQDTYGRPTRAPRLRTSSCAPSATSSRPPSEALDRAGTPRPGRHPPHRRARARLPAAPLLRAPSPQRHREHPPRRHRIPAHGGRHRP